MTSSSACKVVHWEITDQPQSEAKQRQKELFGRGHVVELVELHNGYRVQWQIRNTGQLLAVDFLESTTSEERKIQKNH